MRAHIPFASVVCGLAFCIAIRANEPPRLDLAKIAERGRATAERLTNTPATWVSVNRLESGTTLRVLVTVHGDKSRKVVEMQNGERWTKGLQIIERDKLWYASSRAFARKCRPYELTSVGPIIYMLLDRATLQQLTDPQQLANARLQKIEDGVATFRTPLDPAVIAQVENSLAQITEFAQRTGKPLSAELETTSRRLRDLREYGFAIRLDLATGLFIEHGSTTLTTQVTDFRFLAEPPAGAFNVDDRQWEDLSEDPTAGDVNNLAMIGHQPNFKPGEKAGDLELQLIDVQSGRYRRVPFTGISATPGCFLADRKSVVVHGAVLGMGGLMPYRVDLRTGETWTIAASTFLNTNTLGATLSPDGHTLALMQLNVAGILFQNQIYLVDLDRDKAIPLGKPIDASYLSWMPDGNRILLRFIDESKTKWVATIDMDGTLTKLCPGDSPQLVGDPPRIVYQNRETRAWSSCDLDGKDPIPYANGLTGHSFPAASPDGKRILMMHFQKDMAPVPMVFEYGKSTGRVLTSVPGLWATPAWK